MEDNPSGTVGSVHQDTDLPVMWPATATPGQHFAPTYKMLPDQFQAYFKLLIATVQDSDYLLLWQDSSTLKKTINYIN